MPDSTPRSPRARGRRPSLAASGLGLLLPVTCGVAPFAHGCGPRPTPSETDTSSEEGAQVAPLEIDIFAFGRQLGALAPCGCTTEPLGGLQYGFGVLENASTPAHRLVIEPGSFLFPDPTGPEAPNDEAAWAQALQRASVLQARFAELGEGLVSGLGPTDLASPEGLRALERWPMPRVLANLDTAVRPAPPGVVSHRVVALGERFRAGVTAVVDPTLAATDPDFPATLDPVTSAAKAVDELRGAGVDLTVVIVHGPRALADRIARASDQIDLVVVGGVLEGADRSRLGSAVQRVGSAYVLEPGDQSQTITHLELSIPRAAVGDKLPRPAQWTVIPPRTQREQELSRTEERLAKFQADPSADPTFVARLERERDALAQSLEDGPKPEATVTAVFEQVKITCKSAADAPAQQALREYTRWVSTENQRRFAGVRTPTPAKGEAGYVGVDECEVCHDEAASYWEGTVHARAYSTLVEGDKQFDLSCVGCHVTGFRRPGGAEVVENEGLRAVQCEQCHGPGSRHVDDPERFRLPAHTAVDVCAACHTPEHSDTFSYEAYLRDVLGPGHGAQAREQLGAGPTGRELRAAGLQKAGGACKKM